jgi:phosphate transport system permease protein
LTANLALEMGYAAGDHRAALFATGIVLFLVIVVLNGVAGLARSGRDKPRVRRLVSAITPTDLATARDQTSSRGSQ